MSEKNSTQTNEKTSSLKMLRAMVGIGLICALLIVLTFTGTLPRIEKLKAEALEAAIFKVLPGITKTQAFQFDEESGFLPVEEKTAEAQVVYAGYDEKGQLVGVAVEASAQGYADILRMLYGYSPDQEAIVGLYVLESKETPGLGDKIEKDQNFLVNFNALDASLNDEKKEVANTIVTVKNGTKKNPWEIDGITGATISSRAIGEALGTSTTEWVPLIFANKKVFSEQRKGE